MKNKKLWIFIGIVILILGLNHIFGWSDYLGEKENLVFLKNMVEENLFLASAVYTILTIIGCVVLALPDICHCSRLDLWSGVGDGVVFCEHNAWSYAGFCSRTFLFEG